MKESTARVLSKANSDIREFGYYTAATYSALIGLGYRRSEVQAMERAQRAARQC